MSDAQNLNDFFAQQSKKKKQKKGAATGKAKPAAAQASAEESKDTTATAATTQPVPVPAQDFADSSDDESNQIVINEAQKKIVDRKELEANKKDEEEGNAGWGLGSMIGVDASETSSMPTAAARGPRTGGAQMVFGGKPTFTRKQKGIMDQQDFPDLADGASPAMGAPARSKADGAMMFGGGAMARGPRGDDEPRAEENRPAATKPVFRGKAKLNTGAAATEEAAGSRMNYDFSKMNMSAATNKEARGEGEAGRPRDGERKPPSYDDDFDFEVVKEKEKRAPQPKREYEAPTFGGGKPMFTRGGANREQ